jgi:hypothetical protein
MPELHWPGEENAKRAARRVSCSKSVEDFVNEKK